MARYRSFLITTLVGGVRASDAHQFDSSTPEIADEVGLLQITRAREEEHVCCVMHKCGRGNKRCRKSWAKKQETCDCLEPMQSPCCFDYTCPAKAGAQCHTEWRQKEETTVCAEAMLCEPTDEPHECCSKCPDGRAGGKCRQEKKEKCDVIGFACPLFPDGLLPPNDLHVLEQYTPDLQDWEPFKLLPRYKSHAPRDVDWIAQERWDELTWDGKPFNPELLSKQELSNEICGRHDSGDTVRGLDELYQRVKPFSNPVDPTKAEVDEWHRVVLTHVRELVDLKGEEHEAKKDRCLFARALWGNQRAENASFWDAKYNEAYYEDLMGVDWYNKKKWCLGPCYQKAFQNMSQGDICAGHCGTTFVPTPADQEPYLPEGHEPCIVEANAAEGISSAPNTPIPWSIKWSRAFCGFLRDEGFWGGHTQPFFRRERFGFSFKPAGKSAVLRAKWAGHTSDQRYKCIPWKDGEDFHSCSEECQKAVEGGDEDQIGNHCRVWN